MTRITDSNRYDADKIGSKNRLIGFGRARARPRTRARIRSRFVQTPVNEEQKIKKIPILVAL